MNWQPYFNGYTADCGEYRLSVSRIGKYFRWTIRKSKGVIWLPVKESTKPYVDPDLAAEECEQAYAGMVNDA